jgi:tetratricopeptide (TPR) repeat protein
MMQMAGQAPEGPGRRNFAQEALPLLEDATAADPDDLPAWEGLAIAQQYSGRLSMALTTYETILERAPRRELTLAQAVNVAERLQRRDRAIKFCRRAIDVNPHYWLYHFQLASLLAEEGHPEQALVECDAALKLSPMRVEPRVVQVGSLIELKRTEQARAAFEQVLALKPPNEADLRQWFESQMR